MVITSCARLDANLFNPSKLESYALDDYQGEVDFVLAESYQIDSTMIHRISGEISSTADGETVDVQALFVGEPDRIGDEDYTIILYCHGNRDHMDFYWQRTKLLANVGSKNYYGILTLDYRGYGATAGIPSEAGLYADTAAAIEWLENKAQDNGNTMKSDNFIAYGFSMGTAAVVELTAKPRSDLIASKIILEAPFASAEVMVQDNALLALPDSFFTNLKIDNAEEIKKLGEVPLLWMHGKDDDFLEINSHGEVVFKNHPGTDGTNKHAFRVDGANHSDIPMKLGNYEFTSYTDAIFQFIEQ